MGIKYENQCCDCAVGGYPCTGAHKRVSVYYCDECKNDRVDVLYKVAGQQLCGDCALNKLEKVGFDE